MGKDAGRRRTPLWLFVDVLSFNLAIFTAFAFRLGRSSWSFNFAAYLDILPFAVGVPLVVFIISRVYKTDWAKAPTEELISLFRPVFSSWVVLVTIAYIYRADTVGRMPSSVMLMTLPLATGYVLSWRIVACRSIWAKRRRTERKTLVAVGFNNASLKVLELSLIHISEPTRPY